MAYQSASALSRGAPADSPRGQARPPTRSAGTAAIGAAAGAVGGAAPAPALPAAGPLPSTGSVSVSSFGARRQAGLPREAAALLPKDVTMVSLGGSTAVYGASPAGFVAEDGGPLLSAASVASNFGGVPGSAPPAAPALPAGLSSGPVADSDTDASARARRSRLRDRKCAFNRMYQILADRADTEAIQAERHTFERLVSLTRDFLNCALQYGRIIIAERHLDVDQKTIKPQVTVDGVAGGAKYIVGGILFKFAEAQGDRIAGQADRRTHDVYSTLEEAAKEAGHQLKSLVRMMGVRDRLKALRAPDLPDVATLRFPMMIIIDYLGYRLVAMSTVPIQPPLKEQRGEKDSPVPGSSGRAGPASATEKATSRSLPASLRTESSEARESLADEHTLVYGSCDGARRLYYDENAASIMRSFAERMNLAGHWVRADDRVVIVRDPTVASLLPPPAPEETTAADSRYSAFYSEDGDGLQEPKVDPMLLAVSSSSSSSSSLRLKSAASAASASSAAAHSSVARSVYGSHAPRDPVDVRNKQVWMFGPGDMEIHRVGEEHYALDFARLFPPETDGSPSSSGLLVPASAWLTRLLRPELVGMCDTPLSSDAGSGFESSFDRELVQNQKDDVVHATRMLHERVIPDFVHSMNADCHGFRLFRAKKYPASGPCCVPELASAPADGGAHAPGHSPAVLGGSAASLTPSASVPMLRSASMPGPTFSDSMSLNPGFTTHLGRSMSSDARRAFGGGAPFAVDEGQTGDEEPALPTLPPELVRHESNESGSVRARAHRPFESDLSRPGMFRSVSDSTETSGSSVGLDGASGSLGFVDLLAAPGVARGTGASSSDLVSGPGLDQPAGFASQSAPTSLRSSSAPSPVPSSDASWLSSERLSCGCIVGLDHLSRRSNPHVEVAERGRRLLPPRYRLSAAHRNTPLSAAGLEQDPVTRFSIPEATGVKLDVPRPRLPFPIQLDALRIGSEYGNEDAFASLPGDLDVSVDVFEVREESLTVFGALHTVRSRHSADGLDVDDTGVNFAPYKTESGATTTSPVGLGPSPQAPGFASSPNPAPSSATLASPGFGTAVAVSVALRPDVTAGGFGTPPRSVRAADLAASPAAGRLTPTPASSLPATGLNRERSRPSSPLPTGASGGVSPLASSSHQGSSTFDAFDADLFIRQLHSQGINARHLGRLLTGELRCIAARRRIVVEILARTIRKLLNSELQRLSQTRKSDSDDSSVGVDDDSLLDELERSNVGFIEHFRVATVNFLNRVFGRSDDSWTFWKDTLLPHVHRKFGVAPEAFVTSLSSSILAWESARSPLPSARPLGRSPDPRPTTDHPALNISIPDSMPALYGPAPVSADAVRSPSVSDAGPPRPPLSAVPSAHSYAEALRGAADAHAGTPTPSPTSSSLTAGQLPAVSPTARSGLLNARSRARFDSRTGTGGARVETPSPGLGAGGAALTPIARSVSAAVTTPVVVEPAVSPLVSTPSLVRDVPSAIFSSEPGSSRDASEPERSLEIPAFRNGLPLPFLLERVLQLTGIVPSSALHQDIAQSPRNFFNRVAPFEHSDINSLEPRVKQTPILHSAQGTLFFQLAHARINELQASHNVEGHGGGEERDSEEDSVREGAGEDEGDGAESRPRRSRGSVGKHDGMDTLRRIRNAIKVVKSDHEVQALGRRALLSFDRALALSCNDANTIATLGFAIEDIFRDVFLAERVYRYGLLANPGHIRLQYYLSKHLNEIAILLERTKEPSQKAVALRLVTEAENLLTGICKSNPDHPNAHKDLANILRFRHKYRPSLSSRAEVHADVQAAMNCYRDALKRRTHPLALTNLVQVASQLIEKGRDRALLVREMSERLEAASPVLSNDVKFLRTYWEFACRAHRLGFEGFAQKARSLLRASAEVLQAASLLNRRSQTSLFTSMMSSTGNFEGSIDHLRAMIRESWESESADDRAVLLGGSRALNGVAGLSDVAVDIRSAFAASESGRVSDGFEEIHQRARLALTNCRPSLTEFRTRTWELARKGQFASFLPALSPYLSVPGGPDSFPTLSAAASGGGRGGSATLPPSPATTPAASASDAGTGLSGQTVVPRMGRADSTSSTAREPLHGAVDLATRLQSILYERLTPRDERPPDFVAPPPPQGGRSWSMPNMQASNVFEALVAYSLQFELRTSSTRPRSWVPRFRDISIPSMTEHTLQSDARVFCAALQQGFRVNHGLRFIWPPIGGRSGELEVTFETPDKRDAVLRNILFYSVTTFLANMNTDTTALLIFVLIGFGFDTVVEELRLLSRLHTYRTKDSSRSRVPERPFYRGGGGGGGGEQGARGWGGSGAAGFADRRHVRGGDRRRGTEEFAQGPGSDGGGRRGGASDGRAGGAVASSGSGSGSGSGASAHGVSGGGDRAGEDVNPHHGSPRGFHGLSRGTHGKSGAGGQWWRK